MIESIRLINFQIHKDLALNLGRSTVLQGDSNHGKTAVLRALYWVAYNTPQGDSYVSSWAKNGDKFKEDMYAEVTLVVDGHTIVRHRDNKFNGYVVDGVKYEALRGAVPDAVTQIVNLSDVSIQRQLDAPFLLSMTPGEAAAFLNQLANLEDVSGILAVAKRASADANSAADAAAQEAQAAAELEHKFDWIPEAQKIADECDRLAGEAAVARTAREALEESESGYGQAVCELHPLERALQALPAPVDNSARITACQEGVSTLRAYRDALVDDESLSKALAEIGDLGAYPEDRETGRDRLERLLADYDSLDGSEALARAEAELEALGPCVTATQTPRRRIEQSLAEYDALEDVSAIDAEIQRLEQSLEGATCPTCGRPYFAHCDAGLV